MIHHIDFGVTDLARSREFYVRALAPLGMTAVVDVRHEDGRELIGFGFHAAAVAAGGTDNGAPGLRPRYAEHYYSAYVLDPDGHNIEAVCRLETALP